jgi:putative spermidine/putrescine transport system permease protein
MATLTTTSEDTTVPAPPRAASRPARRPWRGVTLLLAGVYFLVPLIASVVFTVDVPGTGFTVAAYSAIPGAEGFGSSLALSLELALATIVVLLLILVPASIAVRLGPPKVRAVVEVVCSLPLVVPPIAFVAGITTVLQWGPDYLSKTPFFETIIALQNPTFPIILVLAYVVMALPLAYRALDAGLRAIEVPVLIEAARSCGAGRFRAVVLGVLPNMRGAILNAAFLTLALVLGEYTVAQVLGFEPFPVWIVNGAGNQAQLSVAVSIISLLLTWALLLLLAFFGGGRRRGRSRRSVSLPLNSSVVLNGSVPPTIQEPTP